MFSAAGKLGKPPGCAAVKSWVKRVNESVEKHDYFSCLNLNPTS